MKRRVFLDKSVNVAALIELDAPVAARVINLGAQNSAGCIRRAVTVDKRAQVGVSEAIAIHDQHRIAPQLAAGKADRASRAERRGLDHSREFDLVDWLGIEAINDPLCLMAKPQHDPSCTKTLQPIEQIGEVGPSRYGRQYFWQIAEDRPNARAQSAREDENVERLQALSARRNRSAHATGCASDISMSSTILRRNLWRVIRSMCCRVSQPNFCVTESRYRFLVK